MDRQEYDNIKDRLICPTCGSGDIDLYFINSDSEDVSFEYVCGIQMVSEFAHLCECETCGNDDDRCFFDIKDYNESKAFITKTNPSILN